MNPSTSDLSAAHRYLIDPLTEPDPAAETGPGTHFRSTFAPAPSGSYPSPPNSATMKEPTTQVRQTTGSTVNTNPFRKSSLGSKDAAVVNSYPSPPNSASSRRGSHREGAFADYADESPRQRRSGDYTRSPKIETRPRRSSSLRERFPGDSSTHPLDQLKREEKLARRSPHLHKRHIPGPDTIDRLDTINGKYHHEGPYDAALLARNTSYESSPLAAVAGTNAEAIKATPEENIKDAVERHRPIDGVAVVPSGMRDRFGREYHYQEGDDMMIVDGGNYKRWPGIEYKPDDIKGKGEPSFSLEKAFKNHKKYDGEEGGIEMTSRPRNKSLGHVDSNKVWPDPDGTGIVSQQRYREWEQDLNRSNSTGRKVTEGLKKRIGSLRRRKE
ncbi:hypothetical protein K490DRAFT_73301 [Saccharata proteae CBS 121410]|uniref:Pal1-domain-containing protein n=1 Tax=Saccharata proteae CBS 121410 TaxID=1314787 RepID=A0A9P4LY36_9PEZI|nr:hypothetical protein K490DRAFT_73301 [Saccharata proteae CBS 121410]